MATQFVALMFVDETGKASERVSIKRETFRQILHAAVLQGAGIESKRRIDTKSVNMAYALEVRLGQ